MAPGVCTLVRRVLSKGEMRRTATLMITTSCMGMSKRA